MDGDVSVEQAEVDTCLCNVRVRWSSLDGGGVVLAVPTRQLKEKSTPAGMKSEAKVPKEIDEP